MLFFSVHIRRMMFTGLFFLMAGLLVSCQSSKGKKEFQQGLEEEKAENYELALSYFRIAAEQGYAQAQNFLGNYYREGLGGLTPDAKEAVKWYRKAAEQGYSPAQMNLARCYYNGIGVSQDIAATFAWNLKAAKQGDLLEAMRGVAILYENGEGTERDVKKAIKWYRKAAKQGDQISKERLEYLSAYDSYGTDDEVLAEVDSAVVEPAGKRREHLEVASGTSGQSTTTSPTNTSRDTRKNRAGQQSAEAIYQKGLEAYKAHNLEGVRKYFISASEKGHKEALTKLAEYYYEVEKEPTKAFEWWFKAAKQGSAEAQFSLGECYLDGDGVKENLQEALKWYRKAADQGHEYARISLALCYFLGWGVDQDYVKAADYVRALAKAGNADAQCVYGRCLYMMNAKTRNYAEAVKWIQKSVENESPSGTYFYGIVLYEGLDGFPQDRQKAVELIRKAARMDFEEAQKWLDEHNM